MFWMFGRLGDGSKHIRGKKNRGSALFAGFADANPAQESLIVRPVSGQCPCFFASYTLRTSQPALYEQPEHAIPGEP